MSNSTLSADSVSLPVAVDVMGGDRGSDAVVDGAVVALRTLSIPTILVGDEGAIKARLDKLKLSPEERRSISIKHTTQVIEMHEGPGAAIRGKPDASVRRAFELLRAGEACAVVSTGNTGAMMAAGILLCGNLPGVLRPAIASLIPKIGEKVPTVLLDSGANVECDAQQLAQFALMGNFYAMCALGISSPRVALLSNGSESSKGNDVIRSASILLSKAEGINFIGFVEGGDISRDIADVVVCDGLVGNIVLKAIEGTAKLVLRSLADLAKRSPRGLLAGWLAAPVIRKLASTKLDPSSYGGAPLLGLSQVAIVCHGSANSRAVTNAIRVAHKFVGDDLVAKLREATVRLDLSMQDMFKALEVRRQS